MGQLGRVWVDVEAEGSLPGCEGVLSGGMGFAFSVWLT